MAIIDNEKDGKIVNGTSKADTIHNYGVQVTINANKGDDTIFNYSSEAVINGGANNDSIFNDLTLIMGDSDFSVLSDPSYSTLNGGTGNDVIFNYGAMATIYGGKGNDLVFNDGANVFDENYNFIDNLPVYENFLIDLGEGNDSIGNDNPGATIFGGKGNDVISLALYATENLIVYNSGDGDDTIYGFNETSTLQIGDGTGSYSSAPSDDNIILTVGKNKITLTDVASLSAVNINGVENDPTYLTVTNKTKSPVTVDSAVKIIDASTRTNKVKITGNKLDNTINGGSKNDTLYGASGHDIIFGNAGNDSLSGGAGKDTLSGDGGNDKLFGGAGNDSLSGGAGKDTLSGDGGNDKLFGGAGNDSLSGGAGNDSLWGGKDNDTFYYAKGDGKDIIYGFDNKDTLTFDNLEFTTSYSASKGQIVFKVDGGSVTLKDFTATTFHVNDETYQISGSKFVKQK